MRVAIVTGGSRGLGLALCRQLEAADWRLVEFSRGAPHPYSVKTDLSDPVASRRTVAEALAAIDPALVTDLLVINNAGTLDPIGPVAGKPADRVLANLNANFAASIGCLSEVLGRFQASACRKVIANISSGAALHVFAGWSLYCAAKAGLEHFVRALAVEQRGEAHPFVPVNIGPGVIDTEMQAYIRAQSVSDFPDLERFRQRQAQGELKPPAQVAAAVLRIVAQPDLAPGGRYETAQFL